MRRYAVAYGLWLAGVLSAAAVAYYFYRTSVIPLASSATPHPPSSAPDPLSAGEGGSP